MGFPIETDRLGRTKSILATGIDMNAYFSFCEMILTLITAFERRLDINFKDIYNAMRQTIDVTIEKAGFERKRVGREIRIVEKNAVATAIADKVPELADAIIEYNHYLLKGEIKRKSILLKQIADALEPKREVLNRLQKRNTEDFLC